MCDQCVNATPPHAGSRRRRLWDLPHQCHCPVVGVCIPLATLRQLVNKVLAGKAIADDYEIHVGAVSECTQRNKLSELLQKELENRYTPSIQAFRAAKDVRAVAALWTQAIQQGDVTGALWAALTHPRCDAVLQEVVLRDMHMLQHQAGAAVRVDINKFNDLAKEHGVLVRELSRAQERCTRIVADKAAEIEQLQSQVLQQRATLIGKDTQISLLQLDLAQLKAALPDFDQTARLRKKVDQLTARHNELETLNTLLRQQLADAQRIQHPTGTQPAVGADSTPPQAPPKEMPIALPLGAKTVLCVGGRNGNVSNYREVIERAGGNFAHHDGGIEDNQNALDSVLAAADLVICQTGCISHNAYWRVKDFCKRTGKQCVFVENPSTSALTRTLQQIKH